MPINERTLLSISVATLFAAACSRGGGTEAPAAPTRVKCMGINSCSGQGECAAKAADGSELHACAGQNSCTGKGWIEVEQTECQAKGGEVLEVIASSGGTCVANSVPRLAAAKASEEYNLDRDRLGLEGYDPVSYFPEGGGAPKPGLAELTHEHEGVIYRFASEDNLAKFKEDPGHYEPAYGGWCAYAMGKNGRLVKVDPEAYLIENGKLMLFYRTKVGDTRDKWSTEPDRLRQRADVEWSERTGECSAPVGS